MLLTGQHPAGALSLLAELVKAIVDLEPASVGGGHIPKATAQLTTSRRRSGRPLRKLAAYFKVISIPSSAKRSEVPGERYPSSYGPGRRPSALSRHGRSAPARIRLHTGLKSLFDGIELP
jgi:hypothetical protein